MQFIPFPNVAKLEAVYLLDGQYCENVHHYDVGEEPDEEILNGLAATYVSWFDTSMKGYHHPGCTLEKVRVTDLSSSSGPMVEYTVDLPIAGSYNVPALPNSVTIAVKWTTAKRGRSYRGRTFHIGLLEEHVLNNRLDETLRGQFLTVYDLLLTLSGLWGTGNLVIASRIQDGQPLTTGIATLVTGLDIDPIVDSQRRRLPQRGK